MRASSGRMYVRRRRYAWLRAWTLALGVALACGACSRERPPVRKLPLPAETPHSDAGAWARRVAPVRAPEPQRALPVEPLEARTAVMDDEVEDSDESVPIGRLVYRVSFYVPGSYRDRRIAIRAPAGELQIDVSANRLRARFAGPGWPVPEGSEVRLRGDLPGVYLFDGRGGRSLGAGQLAAWFEGRENKKIESMVGVLRAYGPPPAKPLPVELLCALFAEWSHQERTNLAYRCSEGSLPPGFRVGPWSGELTAVVPMEVPRRSLRADHANPPANIKPRTANVMLEAAALARLPPIRALPGDGPAALSIENRSDTRAIVIVQGVPVAWVDAGQSVTIDGFNPGLYAVGAIRPLGILRMAPKPTRIPAQLTIGGRWEPPPRPSASTKPGPDAGLAGAAGSAPGATP